MHWWGWLLGALAMVVFWSLVIWAIWYLVTTLVRRPGADRPAGDPKRILDERLARGEIDATEYQRLRDLMGDRAGHAGHDGRATTGSATGTSPKEPLGADDRP